MEFYTLYIYIIFNCFNANRLRWHLSFLNFFVEILIEKTIPIIVK